MSLEEQAKNVAFCIYKYSTMYGVEPAEVMKKPFLSVRAALGLAAISQRESELYRQGMVDTDALSKLDGTADKVTRRGSDPS
jgi:hypothetical protein